MENVHAFSAALGSVVCRISTAIAWRMNWQIGVPFAGGAMAAMLGGRLVASRLRQRLQQGFAVVAGLIAIGMVAKVAMAA